MTMRTDASARRGAAIERPLIVATLVVVVTVLAIGAVRVADVGRPDAAPSVGSGLHSRAVDVRPTVARRLAGAARARGSCSACPRRSPGSDPPRRSRSRRLARGWCSRRTMPAATGGQQLFVMRTDGTGRRQLTFDAAPASSPAWSPDGTQVVYVSRADGTAGPNLFVVDVRTGRTHQVTHGRVDGPPSRPRPASAPTAGRSCSPRRVGRGSGSGCGRSRHRAVEPSS